MVGLKFFIFLLGGRADGEWGRLFMHIICPHDNFSAARVIEKEKRKKRDGRTNGRTYGQTNGVTMSLLELLIAAKNYIWNFA